MCTDCCSLSRPCKTGIRVLSCLGQSEEQLFGRKHPTRWGISSVFSPPQCVMLKKSVNIIIAGTAEQAVRARPSAYTTAYDFDTIWLYL